MYQFSVRFKVPAHKLARVVQLVKIHDGRLVREPEFIYGVDKYYVLVEFGLMSDGIAFDDDVQRELTPIRETVRKLPWHRRVVKFFNKLFD